ncbi:endonuclease/exonuclease/phosphatase family protein [Aestuariibaculum sediminum]|uniref:Endonuclease/exonuclease/phosphatase family protein n=1 Tax=Aestuariibaculum sediminum TaxID=2770637 RepID=A0A8J6Q815_9FLAO|nr:endonuclease/exonuclease/phosphatase family protein [Aestuariibaculum sediminum]MBD0832235.1 endonuclease/exonuclease/phosphatase family protein [Aestuariibaculum sediminum]
MKNLSTINKFIYFINAILAVVLLISYALPFLPPKTFSVLSVLNLGVPFLIICNVLFLIYWLVKVKKQLMLSLIVLLIGYVFFGSLYKFSSSKMIEDENNIKVMNYNVRLFNVYDWINDSHVQSNMLKFINEQAPDILCIQEFHPHPKVDFSNYRYKFENISGKKLKHGQAIFSKFPIINSGSVAFPNTSNNAVFADIVRHKDTFRVYNVHLESLRISTEIESLKKEDSERLINRVGSTFKMQQFQTELFLKHKKQCKYKMIICGDFNNTAYSYVYRKIKGELNDAFEEAGNGFGRTYDFKFFPVRIDYVFADDAFAVNGFKSYNEHYSDHYPIMATLALQN